MRACSGALPALSRLQNTRTPSKQLPHNTRTACAQHPPLPPPTPPTHTTPSSPFPPPLPRPLLALVRAARHPPSRAAAYGADHVFTEADWNPTASATVLPYYYSKKLAEERAWELAKAQSRWGLVVINPVRQEAAPRGLMRMRGWLCGVWGVGSAGHAEVCGAHAECPPPPARPRPHPV